MLKFAKAVRRRSQKRTDQVQVQNVQTPAKGQPTSTAYIIVGIPVTGRMFLLLSSSKTLAKKTFPTKNKLLVLVLVWTI